MDKFGIAFEILLIGCVIIAGLLMALLKDTKKRKFNKYVHFFGRLIIVICGFPLCLVFTFCILCKTMCSDMIKHQIAQFIKAGELEKECGEGCPHWGYCTDKGTETECGRERK